MGDFVDIKDRTPNPTLVRHLEELLERARSGELRSYAAVLGWDDDSWSHSWHVDARSSRRRALGELSMLQFGVLTAFSLSEGDNVLAQAIQGE